MEAFAQWMLLFLFLSCGHATTPPPDCSTTGGGKLSGGKFNGDADACKCPSGEMLACGYVFPWFRPLPLKGIHVLVTCAPGHFEWALHVRYMLGMALCLNMSFA
jgi:hypothetical protein